MKPLQNLHQSTGSGAVAITISKNYAFEMAEIRVTLGADSTDLADLSVSVDSRHGSAYDHEIAAPDSPASTVRSWRYADLVPFTIFPGDVLEITWPNTDTVTWGIEVLGRY